jgi:hypothetical protein
VQEVSDYTQSSHQETRADTYLPQFWIRNTYKPRKIQGPQEK